MHDRAEKESDPAPKAGDVIAGRFVVEEVLGTGAMGIVVAARSIALKRRVAIKLVKIGSDGYARFEREAVALASLESDHVVRVLEYGTAEDGSPYLVMEFLLGRDLLHELRERGPLPIEEAVDCVLEACVGLAEAHAAGIVHRDIKLGNLFLASRSGEAPRIKVLDFGIAKTLSPQDFEGSLTHPSTAIGSPAYMSPEQVRMAKSVDQRADIWSLGVVLHRLITGKQPFVGEGFSAICAAVATDPAPTLRSERADAPAALEAVVLRCLEKDPSRRIPNVGALALALTPFATPRGQHAAARIKPQAAPKENDGGEETRPLAIAPSPAIPILQTTTLPSEVGIDTASPATVPSRPPITEPSSRTRSIVIALGLAAAAAITIVVAPWKPAKPANDAPTQNIVSASLPEASLALSAAPNALSASAPPPVLSASAAPSGLPSGPSENAMRAVGASSAASAHVRPGASAAGVHRTSAAQTPGASSVSPAPSPSASGAVPFGGKALQSRD